MTSIARCLVFIYIFLEFHGVLGKNVVTTLLTTQPSTANRTLSKRPIMPSIRHTASTISIKILNKTSQIPANLTVEPTETMTNDQTQWPPVLISFNSTSADSNITELLEDELELNSTEWLAPTIVIDQWTIDDVNSSSSQLWNESTAPTHAITTANPEKAITTMPSKGLSSIIKGFGFDAKQVKESTEAIGQGFYDITKKVTSTAQEKFEDISSFASMSVGQIQSYPAHVWSTAKEEIVGKLNANQSAGVLDKIKSIGDEETWRKLINILKEKLDTDYIISIITNQSLHKDSSVNKKLLQTVGDRFGEPDTWNETVVDTFGSSITQIHPSVLMQIKNKAAMLKVFDYLCEYVNSTNDRPESVAQMYSVLILRLAEMKYGAISSWNYINQTLASILPLFQPLNIKKLKAATVKNSTEAIGGVEFYDRAHAQPIIEMILKDVNFTQLSKESTLQLFESLGNLVRHLRVEDVASIPKDVINDDVINNIVAGNSSRLDKELGKWLLSISKPREDEWTSADVVKLQPLLGFASAQLLSELTSKNLLNETALTAILHNQHLDKPQLRAIEAAAIKTFKKGDEWDLDLTPENLFTIIPRDDLKKITNEAVMKHIDKFNRVVKQMSSAQTVVIAQKVQDVGLKQLSLMKIVPHNSYLSLIAFSDNDDEEDFKKIFMNMPIDSPQVQNYVNYKWNRVANNVTVNNFRNNVIMLKSLTCEMLDRLDDKYTMDLLEIVNDANCPLQIKTTICIAEKLKRHLMKTIKKPIFSSFDEDNEEVQVLSTMTTAQLTTIGAPLLLHFNANSLQKQFPRSRCQQIFAIIGQVSLKTLNLLQPPEKKRQIARAALNCMNKPETTLNAADAYVIGNLVGYVPETVLANMETAAFIVSLPHINGKISSANEMSCWEQQSPDYKPPPCLTTPARYTLRNKIINALGSPFNWGETELRSIGCLLSVLYPDQLAQISDAAILSAADELIKCWDETSTSEVYVTLCQKELPLTTTALTAESNRQLKRRLTEAALNKVEIHSRIRRNTNEFSKSYQTCDIVSKLGPAVTEMTVQNLENLPDQNIEDCLKDLGQYLISAEKAAVLWNKIKKALGKTAAEIDVTTYESMGYIAQGLNLTEISTLSLNDSEHIAVFGEKHRNFSAAQLRELANQVLQDYKSKASEWTTDDMVDFGYILCGFQPSVIDAINTTVYITRSSFLKNQIATCPLDTRQAFARKAVSFFGPPSNWTSAYITRIGPVLGGLTPNQLKQVPGICFSAVAPEWIKTIPLESIKALHKEQLGNLTLEAVRNLSQQQLSQLSAYKIKTINEMKGIPSSAQLNWPIRSLASLTLFLMLLKP